ncbi:MAG: HDOD domain-containing protein [Candidatus Polarisedimenticolia bacterium]
MAGSLLEQVNRFAEERKLALPVVSQVALRLQAIVASDEDYDIAEIEKLILSDQALATEVLRAANSPFFGGLAKATTVRNAVVRLGLKEVTRLLLLASERSKYGAHDPKINELLQTLWRHAGACALAASWLARRLGYAEFDEQAFIGGLLHDVGKLWLLRALDEMKRAKALEIEPPLSLVKELIDTAHAAQGCLLLEKWGLPEKYVAVAREHHSDAFDRHNSLLLLVRLANMACRKLGIGLDSDPSIVLMAAEEAMLLGAGDVLLAELEIELEDSLARL